MAKQRKPFVSRKRRKEIDEARTRRETFALEQEAQRRHHETPIVTDSKTEINLPDSLTVGDFAIAINLPVTQVITQLVRNGIMASINDRIDFDTMHIVSSELGFEATHSGSQSSLKSDVPISILNDGIEPRPPIVTMMGHVDHGKTSLLDYIRKSSVAAGEAGGITQHIGAYQATVEFEGTERAITFLDTPGHEAFTALRSHGAQVTDIVVLVVAVDDGVKPQTIEAVHHAQTSGAPIIVAINKMDLSDTNPDKVKQQLSESGLIPEEWGGKTMFCLVSAKTGEGIKELLECIVLLADVKGYKGDSSRSAQGVVIESHQEVGLGAVATLLVQTGTLRLGDILVIGSTYGKVRSMTNYLSQRITEAGPSCPVRISGLQTIPGFGDSFVSVKTEKEARMLTDNVESRVVRHGIESISKAIAEGKANAFNIILKADAQGSLEALKHSIAKIQIPGVKTHVIHSGIGEVSLNDVQLAASGNAVIYGFHTSVSSAVKKAAEQSGVTISLFTIIYELLNQIELILNGRVKIKTVRVAKGQLTIKKIFRVTRNSSIVGGLITTGVATKGALAVITRNDLAIGDGKVTSVQKGPESVNELESGQECGLALTTSVKLQPGDRITFEIEEHVVAENDKPDN